MKQRINSWRTTLKIECANWPEKFPYKPEVKVDVAHDADSLFLEFEVREEWSRALADEMGSVWEDSCVELFCCPCPADGIYYNIECNCIGSLRMKAGVGKQGRTAAGEEVLSKIKRFSTIERHHFEKEHFDVWRIALVIPKEAFFLHDLPTLQGLEMKANFYKCGDNLPTPHYLSFAPIDSPAPDFHLPEFFADFILE